MKINSLSSSINDLVSPIILQCEETMLEASPPEIFPIVKVVV